jgi:hypothetical protein
MAGLSVYLATKRSKKREKKEVLNDKIVGVADQ